MKFSAFMFIHNDIHGGYTFLEAMENMLLFVDEFFIPEGKSDDGPPVALQLPAKLNPKVRIESKVPAYVNSPKDQKELFLGAVKYEIYPRSLKEGGIYNPGPADILQMASEAMRLPTGFGGCCTQGYS